MLKKVLLILGALVLAGGIYFLTIMHATGSFRTLSAVEYGPVVQEIPLDGAEDLTIAYEDDLMFISAFDRAGAVRGNSPTGALYVMNLRTEPFVPIPLDDGLGDGFHPHGISVLKLDSVSWKIWAVNHQNGLHTIESFKFQLPDQLVHLHTHEDAMIVSPNDVIALNEHQFYFTNDHKYTSGLPLLAENYLGLALSNVVFFDGDLFREVAGGIQYANGITIDPNEPKILVAAPRGFEILVYNIEATNDLTLTERIALETGPDNLEWDQNGNLWTGAHPNLLRFASYAKLKKNTAPSEVIVLRGSEFESIYLNDGSQVSASSVAAPYNQYLFIGTVMDDKLLVLEKRR